jgi:hypothetical protein
MATIFHVLGIDAQTQLLDQAGRPQYLLPDGAKAIKELAVRGAPAIGISASRRPVDAFHRVRVSCFSPWMPATNAPSRSNAAGPESRAPRSSFARAASSTSQARTP